MRSQPPSLSDSLVGAHESHIIKDLPSEVGPKLNRLTFLISNSGSPPPPPVQRMVCPTNTSVWTVFFWDPIHWGPGLGTESIGYRTACPTNTSVWTVFVEDCIVHWTRGRGGGLRAAASHSCGICDPNLMTRPPACPSVPCPCHTEPLHAV